MKKPATYGDAQAAERVVKVYTDDAGMLCVVTVSVDGCYHFVYRGCQGRYNIGDEVHERIPSRTRSMRGWSLWDEGED